MACSHRVDVHKHMRKHQLSQPSQHKANDPACLVRMTWPKPESWKQASPCRVAFLAQLCPMLPTGRCVLRTRRPAGTGAAGRCQQRDFGAGDGNARLFGWLPPGACQWAGARRMGLITATLPVRVSIQTCTGEFICITLPVGGESGGLSLMTTQA